MAKGSRASFLLSLVCSVVAASASPVFSQDPIQSPEPQQQEQCEVVGELCAEVDSQPGRGELEGPVNDPAGSYLRSLITIAGIALVVSAYLFAALAGKSIWFRSKRSRA